MTKKHNLSRGERFEIAEQKVKNLEMGARVSQMLIQQIGNSVSPMSRDVAELAGRQRELQYRLLAVQDLLGLKTDEINTRAEQLQVKDFQEASDKEDVEKNYTVSEAITDDSVVLLTSKTADGTGGILRSKLVMKEIGFPQLRQDLLGKVAGDTVNADINGAVHTITVLGVRAVPAAAPEPEVSAGLSIAVAPPQESSTTDEAAQ